MGWDGINDTLCPISRALGVIGDRWTLLILRELLLDVRRFDDLQAQTGMSSSLLSTRLQRMERDGLIERRLYNEKPKRYEYHATAVGRELDPVILMLRAWGHRNGGFAEDAEYAARLVHKPTGEIIDANWRIPAEGKPFTFDDVEASINPDWAAERAANLAAFRSGKTVKRSRPTGGRTAMRSKTS
jgi:DNA-binding HxlR family transcriptional regulator